MKKMHFALAFLVVLVLAFPTLSLAGTLTITFGGVGCGGDGVCSSMQGMPNTETNNFNSGMLPAMPSYALTGNAMVVKNNNDSIYRAPTGDMTYYITTGSGTINITNLPNNDFYYGLYWGSLDKFNTIVITDSMGNKYTITGTQIGTMSGTPSNGTSSLYVNFNLAGASIASILMESSQNAFESDNGTFGYMVIPTPEPATLSVLGVGLFLFGAGLRRKLLISN